LDPRERELLIMRTAFRCRARYEWAHHERIGRRAGLTADDLAALERPEVDDGDPRRALLLRTADELVTDRVLSDPTWADLASAYPVPQIIEICLLVGEYAMLAGALNSLGVRIEEGFSAPSW
jgi:4-carboxymuconolactone decarboxylase